MYKGTISRSYMNKIMIGVDTPNKISTIVRHEVAHATWHKIPQSMKDKIKEKIKESGMMGHTDYASSFIKKIDDYESNSRVPMHDEDKIKQMEDIWINEIHSEYFAVRDYPDHRGEYVDTEQFKKIGKILESVLGKEYMEKSIRSMEKTLQRVSRYGVIEA